MTRKKHAPEKLARPTRTALQGGAGGALAVLIDETFYDLTDAGLMALALVLTTFIGWVQVTIEDYTGRALLRSIPPTEVPIVE